MREGGEWAVVLGASAGSGAAIARGLARDPGLHLFGAHRGHHPADAAGLCADVQATGRRAEMWVADAGTAEAAVEGARALREVAGPRSVKVLVHSLANASVGTYTGAERLDARRFQKTFDSMAHSFVYWAQQLVELDLLAPGARLIGLTNTLADSLIQRMGLIAAAKAALAVHARVLAAELGPQGHRVNIVSYGLAETRAVKAAFPEGHWDHVKGVACAMTPAGRLCSLEEVAGLVSVLAGPTGEWFNGATIDFTGGMIQSLLGLVVRPPEKA